MTLGLTGFVVFQAASAKQDTETSRKAQNIATKLNSYVNTKGVPETLSEANIKDVPSTITYSKTGGDKYEFCVTYKHASDGYSGGGFSEILTGGIQRNLQSEYPYDDYTSSYTPSSLYLPYSHKAGKNCQTVKTYSYNYDYNPSNSYNSSNLDSICDSGLCDSSVRGSGSSSSANDTERQTDIKAIHGQIEAYYAQNGYYPSLANMNDSNWRKTNLKGLDNEALRDPKGTTYILVNAPIKNSYSYTVGSLTGKPCDNSTVDCVAYTLTATLDNGTSFSKYSLN